MARQPILDKYQRLFGYELLFRDSESNAYQNIDGDAATFEVIRNSFINIGMNKVTQGKKAFINFTENVLKSDIFTIMPPRDVVVEVLETVEPTEEIIKRCSKLKKDGFTLALDDFIFHSKYERLIELADIIKVDFRATRGEQRRTIIEQVKSNNIRFLAEKVENLEEFNEAVELGYTYFQGFYFSKPVIMSANKLPENKVTYLRILKEVNSTDFSTERIEKIIKKDVALSYKLLKLINSAKYSFRNSIQSMRQAIALLGEQELKRWLYVIAMQSIGSDKPEHIMVESLVRARFMELLAMKNGMQNRSFDAYLIGMLSKMDVLLDIPISEILHELLVPREVEEVLTGKRKDEMYSIYSMVVGYEKSDWDRVQKYASSLDLEQDYVVQAYFDAIAWVNKD